MNLRKILPLVGLRTDIEGLGPNSGSKFVSADAIGNVGQDSNVHNALFVAKFTKRRDDWLEFITIVLNRLQRDANCVRLGENIWLVNVKASQGTLAWLVKLCEQREITYGVLPLADEPRWIPADFDPKKEFGIC
jgi:hypothetical protein